MAAETAPLDSSLTEMDWLGQLNIRSAAAGNLCDLDIGRPTTSLSVDEQSQIDDNGLVTACDRQCLDRTDANAYRQRDDSTLGGIVQRCAKPPFSYTHLISCAINSTPNKRMALNDIYQWISDSFPYYKDAAPGWKVSMSIKS
jgi:hypothetical protein